MTHPTFKITTVDDFLSVPPDRLRQCLSEFLDWLIAVRAALDLAHQAGADLERNFTFEWTDDGERSVTINLDGPDGRPIGSMKLHGGKG